MRVCDNCGVRFSWDAIYNMDTATQFCSESCWIGYNAKIKREEKQMGASKEKALDIQIDGDHYKKMKIQVVEFCMANDIPYMEGNVIKYVCRWKSKNGISDLKKARHYLDLLIEEEEANLDGTNKTETR